MGFAGASVLALESRRANEIGILIKNQQGVATVAPSMREVPIDHNTDALAFAERLFAGDFDMMVLLTGVGTRALAKVIASRYPAEAFPEALRKLTIAARGPKPVAALREMGLKPDVLAPEPNTWRELLGALDGRPERRVAVQEYGRPNEAFLAALRERGCEVTRVPVYDWMLPEDTAPLRDAARRLAAHAFDFAFFTTSIQVEHLLQIAGEEGVDVSDALRRHTVVASIGPTCSERLAEYGFPIDIEPSHPKMGFLIKETADQAAALLARKRSLG
jgi:uroporphyrinogen-III synthase